MEVVAVGVVGGCVVDGWLLLFLGELGLWHCYWLDECPRLVLLHLFAGCEVHALREESCELVML